MKLEVKWFSVVAILLCSLVCFRSHGQLAGNTVPNTATFRIGYVRQDPEAITTSGVYQQLVDFLVAQPAVIQAMKAADVRDIRPVSYDTHGMLNEAMDANQLDLAFCSALDYSYQRGNYEPVFQIRRPGDPHSSSGERRVWHSGVIFVSARSPLFAQETSAALAALPAYVMEHGIAMVGSSSAAGYVYPYLALDRLTSSVPVMNARSDFRDSSSEVIKAVVNGIYDVGACDSSAIDEVLKAHGLLPYKKDLIREILRTDPVPRDPIVLNERWVTASPYGNGHSLTLGREVTRAVGGFFRQTPGLPALERTSREPFVEVTENLERFRLKREQAASAAAAN